ncbi:MAG: GAF domain-containing protein [Planctomycetes bacterium]|nr:GAF domain-containing protein [Planctomycetota bacterium]
MKGATKAEQYEQLVSELRGLVADERDWLANLANAAALLGLRLPDLNWAGFYLLRAGRLTVGPFQGKPACVHIELSRGVCGASASRRETIVVPDVHQFPGHIACDEASQSEIVVPLVTADGRLLGVLDLDSPKLARFDEADARGLEQFGAVLTAATDWPAEIP